MSSPISITRRRTLSAIGGASVASAAGCLGGGSTSDKTVQSLPRPTRGDDDAAVTVAVFEDFACPHCRTFATQVYPEIESTYIEEGIVRYEHYDFPIPVDDRWSWRAPIAARAVQDSAGTGAFFEFVETLFADGWSEGRHQYTDDLIGVIAGDVGADADTVRRAAADGRYRPVVEADRETGTERGVGGTPAVFVDGTPIEEPTYSAIESAVEDVR
ncbi:DsbA family protein [Halobaculum magnesiiphilum]|uniref:DsbA family protein n=1 Tax=Halobaculum magnesiiphilum TaxID=1017351 RepID=A0A8T8WD30_9EURY|nr:thioredoxin domain-containing protein [Halobaculum magnesiiphilum]QZP37644.1 DsbA family protein [Halobaculum magnesiiphilum]